MVSRKGKKHQKQERLDNLLKPRISAAAEDSVIELDSPVAGDAPNGHSSKLLDVAGIQQNLSRAAAGDYMLEQQTQPAHEFNNGAPDPSSNATQAELVDLTCGNNHILEDMRDAAAAPGSMSCPVCSKTWPVGSISNLQLNQHIDQCLSL